MTDRSVYPLRKKIRNFNNRPANEEAARQIKSYWAAKGHDIEAFVIGESNNIYAIKSNLLNGLPKSVVKRRLQLGEGT